MYGGGAGVWGRVQVYGEGAGVWGGCRCMGRVQVTLYCFPMQAEVTMYVTVTTPGAITGIAYWFELAMQGNLSISTGPSAYKGVCIDFSTGVPYSTIY